MTALNAPRDLNEFDSWIDSTLIETRVPAASESHGEWSSGVRRTYGAIRARARRMSIISAARGSRLRQNLRQVLRKRRACQHIVDAGLTCGVDDVHLHVRCVADRAN